MNLIDTAIAAAAAELDAKYPEWCQAIDLTDFDMGSTQRCVLGQVAQSRGRGYGDLLDEIAYGDALVELAFDLGYAQDSMWEEIDMDEYDAWRYLASAWMRYIEECQREVVATDGAQSRVLTE